MAITFDVLDRFRENEVFQTAQIMNNIPTSMEIRCSVFGVNHSNYAVKTEFFKKEQSYVNIRYLLQQHTKLLLNRF